MLDFSKVINRRGTDCEKWDYADNEVGVPDLIQLGCADMDFQAPPEIIASLQQVLNHGVFGYTYLNDAFVEGIVSWYKKRHQVELDPESVIFAPRIVVSSSMFIELVSRPSEKVILNAPYYPPLNNATERNGRVVIDLPLSEKEGRYVIDFAKLESQVDDKTRMMILVSPHNPTTRVWTKEELQEVAYFCERHHLYLYVDEIHCDFIRQGHKFVSFASIDSPVRERLVIANSAAKSFNIMGCNTSYCIVPNKVLRNRLIAEFNRIGAYEPNIFGNAAMKAAYQKCAYYVDAVNPYIDGNEDYLRTELPKIFPEVVVKPREGSYLLWVDFTKVFPNEAVTERFCHEMAKINPFFGLHFGRHFENFMRINLGCPRATLEEVIKRLDKAYATYKAEGLPPAPAAK